MSKNSPPSTSSLPSLSSVMKYWNADSNCAQSVSCGLLDLYNFKEEKETLHPALINFGGGFGEGSICGAISGSLAAMSLIFSKKELNIDNDKIKELRDLFKIKIKDEFNSLLCRDYMKPYYSEDGEIDWDVEGRREKCTKVVQKAFEEAKSIIDDSLANSI